MPAKRISATCRLEIKRPTRAAAGVKGTKHQPADQIDRVPTLGPRRSSGATCSQSFAVLTGPAGSLLMLGAIGFATAHIGFPGATFAVLTGIPAAARVSVFVGFRSFEGALC